MTRLFSPVHRTLAAAALGLGVLALGLGACAKKITEVDPSYTQPEGRISPFARLLLWYEAPVQVSLWHDFGGHLGPQEDPFCPQRRLRDVADRESTGVRTYVFGATGAVNLAILDRTEATAFRPMRREANGGYRAMIDFPLAPARRWLDQQWEIYTFQDPSPSGHTPPTYIGRGLVGGNEGADTPLTNEAQLQPIPIDDIRYEGNCLPCDSLFTIRWEQVPNATRIWLHVYQFTSDVTDRDILMSTRPTPVNTIKPKDFLIASLPGEATSYRLGDNTRSDVEKVVERPTGFGQIYNVRISAVDASGRLIAFSRGDFGVLDEGENYGLFPMGAYLINPKRPGASFPFCQPETP